MKRSAGFRRVRGAMGFLLLGALAGPLRAEPHLAGENAADHLALLALTPKGIRIDLVFDLAEFPAEALRKSMDRNRDGRISSREVRSWLGRSVRRLLPRLKLLAGGKPLKLRVLREGTRVTLGRRETGPYPLRYSVALFAPLPKGPYPPGEITFENHTFPSNPGFIRAYLTPPKGYRAEADIPPSVDLEKYEALNKRINKKTGSAYALPRNQWPPQLRKITWRILPGGGEVAGTGREKAPKGAGPASKAPPRASNPINEKIRRFFEEAAQGRLSFLFLLLAVIYGAGHALMPGHGKAITGAFLVGHKGRIRDAVLLGLVVTFTHTFVVFALGIAADLYSESIENTPELRGAATRILDMVSSGLILGIGLFLAWRFGRALWRQRKGGGPLLFHAHDHAHPHEHHDHVHPHPHDHDHGHPHDHDHDHPHDHGHGHHHGHSHEIPLDPKTGRPKLWEVLWMGISGGIVPCPTGLVIVSLAFRFHLPGLGLLLVVFFSLGMAAVLVGIGVGAVKGVNLVLTYGGKRAEKAFQVLPLLSALFITGLGAFLLWAALQV